MFHLALQIIGFLSGLGVIAAAAAPKVAFAAGTPPMSC
jgi:hypothetical protein